MSDDRVTICTVTRGRPRLLQRAIRSVAAQTHPRVHHIILSDGCERTYSAVEREPERRPNLDCLLRARRASERSGPAHLAYLRNLLIRMSHSDWVGFLDDDNQLEPDHISSLLDTARQTGCLAVHSWMRMFHFDGAPYTTPRWPWCRDPGQAADTYAEMVANGAVTPGDNILRDDPSNFPQRCVDTSAWLLARRVLSPTTMSTRFSEQEWRDNKAEDDKLLAYLLDHQIPIACSEKPTLRYYLGGYSNNHDGAHSHSETWRWQPDDAPSSASRE